MKKLFASLLLVVVSLVANAADVRIGWDYPTNITNVGFMVYAWTNQVVTPTNLPALKLDVNTNMVALVENLKPGRWHLAVTAYTQLGVESDFSTILTIEVPKIPSNMRMIITEYSTSLTATNAWQDVGFFRVRIQ